MRSDVGSMDCVAGAAIVHSAFFFAEAPRRGRGSATLVGTAEGGGATPMGLVASASGKTATVSWRVDGPEKSEEVALAAGENGQLRWARDDEKRLRGLQGTRHTFAVDVDSFRGHCWKWEGATARELKLL